MDWDVKLFFRIFCWCCVSDIDFIDLKINNIYSIDIIQGLLQEMHYLGRLPKSPGWREKNLSIGLWERQESGFQLLAWV
jgi:hypothetical protein